ncbi:MAG: pyridoxamine 5'-phosphate oxidase family protein [Actinobacteria bacterium]|nr:pyridoxamine 5'-phosphate oxidase family protein [Actinomycetota bacterium]
MLDPAITTFAQGTNFAALSFHLPNGQIATQVMWIDADDEHLLINTEVHRAKYRAIVESPTVTVMIWDAQNPYHYAEVRGTFVGEVRGDQARAHIDACSRRYTGVDYQAPIQSERVILKIAPVRQRKKDID